VISQLEELSHEVEASGDALAELELTPSASSLASAADSIAAVNNAAAAPSETHKTAES